MAIVIRNARLDDVRRLLEIYAYYVEHTAITFEYDVPSFTEFQRRMENIKKEIPLPCH